jgi:quercetin dioxygenase-like cupin family protein
MTTNPITRLLAPALLLAAACTRAEPPAPATPAVAPVLSASETILGQPFAYPQAGAEVTAVIVTLPPGAATGWHRHPVPLFGSMLAGELTVAYEGAGTRTYRPGDALMEAIGTPHDGRNDGAADVRILAVFIGAEGIPNSEKVE